MTFDIAQPTTQAALPSIIAQLSAATVATNRALGLPDDAAGLARFEARLIRVEAPPAKPRRQRRQRRPSLPTIIKYAAKAGAHVRIVGDAVEIIPGKCSDDGPINPWDKRLR